MIDQNPEVIDSQVLDALVADEAELSRELERAQNRVADLEARKRDTARSIQEIQRALRDQARLDLLTASQSDIGWEELFGRWAEYDGLDPEAVVKTCQALIDAIERNRGQDGLTTVMAVDGKMVQIFRVGQPKLVLAQDLEGLIPALKPNDDSTVQIRLDDGCDRRILDNHVDVGMGIRRYDGSGVIGSEEDLANFEKDNQLKRMPSNALSGGRIFVVGEDVIAKVIANGKSQFFGAATEEWKFSTYHLDTTHLALLGACRVNGMDLSKIVPEDFMLNLPRLSEELLKGTGYFGEFSHSQLGNRIVDGTVYFALLASGVDKNRASILCAKSAARIAADSNRHSQFYHYIVEQNPGADKREVLAALYGV